MTCIDIYERTGTAETCIEYHQTIPLSKSLISPDRSKNMGMNKKYVNPFKSQAEGICVLRRNESTLILMDSNFPKSRFMTIGFNPKFCNQEKLIVSKASTFGKI